MSLHLITGMTLKNCPAFPPLDLATGNRSGTRLESNRLLRGELFISIDDSVAHARRFRTMWQAELVRYIIHGLLHLEGYDDVTP